MRKVDIVSGAVFVIFGAVTLIQSLQLSFFTEGVPGPGFFPGLLAGALMVTGALLVVTRVAKPEGAFEDFAWPTAWQARRSLGLWIAALGSVLLIGIVGFLLAMFVLVGVLLFVIEGRRSLSAVATVIITPLLAYGLFGVLLQVRLPLGLFGD